MLLLPIPFRRRKKRTNPVTVQPLELIAGVYSINDALVTLTFNREINLDDLDVSVFWVNDGLYTQQKLQGESFATDGTSAVQIFLTQVESYSGSTTILDAGALNGIKDVSTGANWGGATGFVLTTG